MLRALRVLLSPGESPEVHGSSSAACPSLASPHGAVPPGGSRPPSHLRLVRPHVTRSLPAIRAKRGYPQEGTSSVGGYQPKRATPARFDPPPRKGTAPCLVSVPLLLSSSSSRSLPCLPLLLRQHAPTETALEASSQRSGARSPRSSFSRPRTAAVELIRGESAFPAMRPTRWLRSIIGARRKNFACCVTRCPLRAPLFLRE
jgi:hypothetical protein